MPESPPDRRPLLAAGVIAALVVAFLLVRGCGAESAGDLPGPPRSASTPAATPLQDDRTYPLSQLPAPVRAPARAPAPASDPSPVPVRPVVLDGALGTDQGEVTRVPDLTQALDDAHGDPTRLLERLDAASPEALGAHVRARAAASPHLAPLLAAPPGAPRAQLLHQALLAEAIVTRERLQAEHGERLPLAAALTLAELNLEVAERGLNDPQLQAELDADLVAKLGAAGPERLDEAFQAAQAALDRVTRPGPPPEDPRALAREQASAYYRVLALAALRLEHASGGAVPGLTPEVSGVFGAASSPASAPQGGMSDALGDTPR